MPDEPTPDGSSGVDPQATELPPNETPAPAPERTIREVAPPIVEAVHVESTDATPVDATPTSAPTETSATPGVGAPPPGESPPKKKRRRRRKKKKPGQLGASAETANGAQSSGEAPAPEGEHDEEEGEGEAAEAKDGAPHGAGEGAPSEGSPGEGAKTDGGAKPGEKKDKKKRDKKKPPKGPPREKPPFAVGEEVAGKITKVLDEALMIDVAGKALGIFDRGEAPPSEVFTEGERFIGKVTNDGARGGLVVLTRDLNRWQISRAEVEEAFENKTPVLGLVTGAIRGGVEVDVKGLRGFAPASHVDLRLGADLHHLIGRRLPFDVVQFAKRGREFVLSRKAALEEDAKKLRAEALQKLVVGSVVRGVVRSVTQFGAFIDVGGIDGLVHITEASHTPKRLSEVFKVGDETEVKILSIDDKGKVWLSKRATEPDPWAEARTKYARGTVHKAKVVRLQPFGAFIELEPGIDGLMHVSDIASSKPFKHPSEVLEVGKEIDVIVASNDAAHHKIALHPAPKEGEMPASKPPPRLAPHQAVKVVVEAQEINGLVVRIVGQTGRNAKAYIPATATNTPKGTDLRKHFPIGKELEAKIVEMGPRGTKLSIKALAQDQERASFRQYQSAVKQAAKFGTFGDLLMKKGITK